MLYHRNTTWIDYGIITNMGAKVDVLAYVDPVLEGETWWFYLTSQWKGIAGRVVSSAGMIDAARSYRDGGARPALNYEGIKNRNCYDVTYI